MRRAKSSEATSDVTRFRGVAIAALLAGLGTLLLVVYSGGREGLRASPGPLSPSHHEAGLQCQQCHGEAGDASAAAAACTGCHGGYSSTRTGHQQQMREGGLRCADCHQVHRANEGVTLLADGTALRYGKGGETPVATIAGYAAGSKTRVPIVNAGACARCHDLASSSDPLAACLLPGQESLGKRAPSLCLDEHTLVGGHRDAAWEAARQAVAAAPLAPSKRASLLGPWSWLGIGCAFGLVLLGASRLRSSQRSGPQGAAIVRAPELLRLPTINSSTCLGCHACVDACPFDVLEIRHYVAVVARPEACCGLTVCEQRCPNGSLVMGDGEAVADAVPIDDALQSRRVPGLFLAGDVTGLPLIRNAINQGAHAMRSLCAELGGARGGEELDVVIVGAGPAGISAALEAKAEGLRYTVLEQGSVAQSIQSFPRAKLVFDQPLDLPLVGKLWLEESSKEELLSRWLRVIRSERLSIEEGWRVASIVSSEAGTFTIETTSKEGDARTLICKRVLLAIGSRGTARRLPVEIPESMQGRVFYSLADARTFAGQKLVVVGLGDVAMEAAIALSRQPGTQVTVVHRGEDFRRGKARNIEELQRRIAAGALELRLQTEIQSVSERSLRVAGPNGRDVLACDGLFVFIGAIPPIDFLSRVGVLPGPSETASDKEDRK